MNKTMRRRKTIGETNFVPKMLTPLRSGPNVGSFLKANCFVSCKSVRSLASKCRGIFEGFFVFKRI